MSQASSPAVGVDPSAATADIPVTVIGGYLGSGKTTLVNHLLAAGLERIAVLVNDFGEVDIDADLIEQSDGDTIALANGCICCSLVDGLAAALDTIASLEPRPDRLVIEASGVADPATVAAYGHGPGYALDAVVVLVDAETVRQRAVDRYVGDTVIGQLRSADIVVVNKVDLVTPAVAADVVEWLGPRVDRALVVEAARAEIDPAVLFGHLAGERRPEPGDEHGTDRGDDRGSGHGHGAADEVYQNWTWVGATSVTRSAIEELMEDLPDAVVRAKGVLRLDDDPDRPQVLQRVGRRWSIRPVPATAPAATSTGSRLVLIGRRGAVDDGWLEQRLGA